MCVCLCQTSVYSEEKPQADTLLARAGDLHFFTQLYCKADTLSFFFFFCFCFSEIVFIILDNLAQFCLASCFKSELFNWRTSTRWTQSSGSWRWGLSMLLIYRYSWQQFTARSLQLMPVYAYIRSTLLCVISCITRRGGRPPLKLVTCPLPWSPTRVCCLQGEQRLWETETRPLGLKVCQTVVVKDGWAAEHDSVTCDVAVIWCRLQ